MAKGKQLKKRRQRKEAKQGTKYFRGGRKGKYRHFFHHHIDIFVDVS